MSYDFSGGEFAPQSHLFGAFMTTNFCGEWEHLSENNQM